MPLTWTGADPRQLLLHTQLAVCYAHQSKNSADQCGDSAINARIAGGKGVLFILNSFGGVVKTWRLQLHDKLDCVFVSCEQFKRFRKVKVKFACLGVSRAIQ